MLVRGEESGKGSLGSVGWICTHFSVQCYVAAWMGARFGGEWIHVCVWLSPSIVLLKLPQHS